ncbi:hypothetical protein TWF694_009897 [Orbilia ellipsospora]
MKINVCDDDLEEISATCANARELNLSCNLFEDFEQVTKICFSLPKVESLTINGNRFAKVQIAEKYAHGFSKIKTLKAEDLRSTWAELFELVDSFTNVVDLSLAVGDLQKLAPTIKPQISELRIANRLESICLEEHAIETLIDLEDLQRLPCLRRLLLARNKIRTVYSTAANSNADDKLCFPSVTFLDVSNNQIDDWKFLDDIRTAFPKLESLRIGQNPLYNNGSSGGMFQITVGRLHHNVTTLNFSVIKSAERADAELFYISTIVKELSEKPVEQEADILSRHTRWQELQSLHGEQTINRDSSQKPKDALASRLIEVEVSRGSKTLLKKFPRNVTIGKLSGLIGRLFGANPLDISLYLIEDGIGENGVRETMLVDELRELDYYVVDANAKLAVRDK